MAIADQFLQYGALRAQQSQNLGENIGATIDMAMRMKMQREADLAAKLKEEQAKQEAARRAALEPEAVLAKANQFGPESLTPEERAAFQASQQIQGAKVVYDQFGQPRSGYNPIQLGAAPTGIAATPLMPQNLGAPPVMEESLPILAAPASGMLMPPPSGAAPKTQADFDSFMAGGKLPPPEAAGTIAIVKTAEQRLADMGITKPVRPERLDFASAEQYKSELAAYNDAKKQAVEATFSEKKAKAEEVKVAPALIKDLENSIRTVDKAIEQSNRLNTGFIGGQTVLGKNINPFASNLQATLGTVQARTALDALVQAKERGATFGALSDAELQLLKDRTASLDRTQSPEQLDQNLKEIRNQYDGILQKVKSAAGVQSAPSGIEAKLKAAGYSAEQIRAYKQAKGIK